VEGIPRDVHPIYLDYMGQKRQEIADKEAERQAEKQEKIVKSEEAAAENDTAEIITAEGESESQEKKRWGNGNARINQILVLDKEGMERSVFETGSDITIRFNYNINQIVENAVIGIGIFRSDGVYCYGTNTRLDKLDEFNLEHDGTVDIKMENVMLMPGVYTFDLAIESDVGVPVDCYREAATVELYTSQNDVGLVRIRHDWKINR